MHPHTLAIDLDGTLLTAAWPGLGEWQPGAIEAMHALNRAGCHLIVHTARIAPVAPWGTERPAHEVAVEGMRIREKLDEAGLTFMSIHTHPWKPGARGGVSKAAP